MKITRVFAIILAIIMCAGIITGCFGDNDRIERPEPSPDVVETPDPEQSPTPDPTPTPIPVNLVEFDGVVEHLFFHEMIAYPEIAFPDRTNPHRVDDYMITVNEYKKILESLHRNKFVLVSMHDVWEEYVNESGQTRMREIKPLMIPEGKKPIILSFDDLTFHQKPLDAFMSRYIIGEDGDIWAEGIDPSGNTIITQDLAAITILDKFIKENPDFSHNGAKGCIAQTGLYGVLGYRTQTDRDNDTADSRTIRMQEIARARPVIARLKETGWYWASHSWGHISFENASLERVKADAERWNDEVASLVGNTKIMIYAFGSRLDGNDVRTNPGPALMHYVEELGFRMFASVGPRPYITIRSDLPAVMMDRMASDGITLRSVVSTSSRERFMRFYDARDVFDPLRPEGRTIWD